MAAFVSSLQFVNHYAGPHHPERPDRIRAIYRGLYDAGLISSDPFPDFALSTGLKSLGLPKLIELTPESPDEKWLSLVHTAAHVERIKQISGQGGGVLDQGDTSIAANGHEIALLSLGSALTAVDAVMSGRTKRAFSAARPPGHHAEPDRAMGFCIYSNIAIAARYIQQNHGVERVAIVDFDVHHGNGTQACLEDDATALFVSMHQHPATCYPGSGHEWEVGVDAGRGHTLNIPFNPGADDDDYMQAMSRKVIPKLEHFRPEVLLISAGFDAHREDPLAQINLSEDGYEQITRSLVALAESHCSGRVISVLEGGYNLLALARSVVRHVKALSSDSRT